MLRDYQERAIKLLYGWLATHQGNPCIVAPTGCHARGQGILMANGSVHAVEDINVGDRVMGGDGTPRMVIDLHRGNSMMYKIVPIKGKPFVVNEGHVLSLISTNEGKEYNCSTTGKEIINISVKDYLAKSNNWKHLHKLYRGKVEVFEGDSDAHLLIPPYIVGILLGDGSLDKGAALTNPDFEIYFDWHCYLANIGCYARILKKSTTECCTYSAVSINKKDPDKRTPRGTSEINKRLRAVGIFGMKAQSKRVPDNYKTCSYKNRLELLAGLLDTDGSLSGPNGYDYISKSEQLSKDVAFISQSLGLRAICHPCIKTCSNTGKSGMYYRVSISGDTSIIPCRLPKKQAQPLKQKKRPNVTGFTVEPVGVGEFFGFETDGDHLYMLDDFTVTHNSGKSHIIAGLCQDVMRRWPASRILILSHVKELLQQDAEKLIAAWPEVPLGIYSAGMNSRDIGLPVTVAGIQSVRDKAMMLGFVDICIVDECFIAGTLIKTPHGDIPIERLRPGDKVFNALGVGKIEAISQKETTNLIRLEFDDGTITSCTENHPFFTSNGWKKAGELENGTHILSFKEMRILWKSFYSVDKKRRGREIYLRNARKTLGKTKILFNFLCEKSRKPHERQTKQREDETNTSANTAQAHSKGRKRETASIASACAASCTWGRLGCGICCKHRGQEQVSPLCLQNRHSKSCAKNSDRGRRTVTQHNGAKGAGHKENKPFNFVRVVSVSRVKCESPCAVFNVQVSGHPSYFADEHLVHNCHLISAKAEGGYRNLIAALMDINPNMRVIGLTATPYRLGHGLISENGGLFNGLIEPVKVEELVARGYLAPLRSKLPEALISVEGVAKRGGEFVESELQAKVNNEGDNTRIVEEVMKRSGGRKAWLFFCTGINHAYALRDILTARGVAAETVTGATPIYERNRILADYKAGRITALTNMDVLTTGFDYPGIDLIAMCRPTMSPGLYIQMAGRGMRIAPEKEDCLVLDFAGNVKRHGPITCVQPPKHKGSGTGDAPVKVCPECDELLHTSIKVCPACGYEFPAPEKPPVQLHDDDIMGNEPQEMDIKNWWWSVRTSRAKGVQMLCVEYEDAILTGSSIKEFITILHDGYARYRAEVIMQEMIKYSGANLPNFEETTDYLETVAEAMNNARCPAKIEYKKDGQYYRVLRRIWSTPAAVGA